MENKALNRKHLFGNYDDADDDDYEFLGSRLRHAVQSHDKKPVARLRRDRDTVERDRPRHRPEPYRDRSF